MSDAPLKTAIAAVGSMRALADHLGVTKGAVHQWTLPNRKVPANHCASIEAATGGKVTRYQLRPDVFGEQPTLRPKVLP